MWSSCYPLPVDSKSQVLNRSLRRIDPLSTMSLVLRSRFHTRSHKLCVGFSTLAVFAKAANYSFTKEAITICEKRAPPRYGKTIPRHILSRHISGGSQKDKDHENSIDVASLSIPAENREDCPLCKKYSQGPCGSLFKKWIQCLDKQKDNESKCDALVIPLEKCLKQNKEFYDKISVYDDDDDKHSMEDWIEFISQIEKSDTTSFRSFSAEKQPEMQVRLESKMGAAMFHKNIGNNILLMAYVKDQDGNIIGAGSSEDLYPFQGQYVLRFGVEDSCRDVTAHGLYGSEENDDNNVIIFTKTERIPSR